MKKKNILVVFGGAAVLVLCVLFGAFFAGPLLALASSSSNNAQPAATGKANPYCLLYQKDLAGRLNVSTATLSKDQLAAREDVIDQRVKDGKLTQKQADALKQRLENKAVCTVTARGNRGFGFGAPALLQKFRQELVTQLAQSLHLTVAQLKQQLMSGKSISDIASAQHISLTQLKSTLTTTIQNDLNTAVKNGTITQQQADKFKQFIQNHPQLLDKLLNAHRNAAKQTATGTSANN